MVLVIDSKRWKWTSLVYKHFWTLILLQNAHGKSSWLMTSGQGLLITLYIARNAKTIQSTKFFSLENHIIQLAKKLTAFYETQSFITTFTEVRLRDF
jgi:hypothetical protein